MGFDKIFAGQLEEFGHDLHEAAKEWAKDDPWKELAVGLGSFVSQVGVGVMMTDIRVRRALVARFAKGACDSGRNIFFGYSKGDTDLSVEILRREQLRELQLLKDFFPDE